MEKTKELITDTEWKEYLEEEHNTYIYCKPNRQAIEQFLQWRQKRDSNGKTKTAETEKT